MAAQPFLRPDHKTKRHSRYQGKGNAEKCPQTTDCQIIEEAAVGNFPCHIEEHQPRFRQGHGVQQKGGNLPHT